MVKSVTPENKEPKIQPCEAKITKSVGRVSCFWEDSGTEITVNDVKTRSEGIEGVYNVYHHNGTGPQKWLTGVRINFVTALARKTLALQLQNAAMRFAGKSEYDWDSVVEQLSSAVIDSENKHNEFDEVDIDQWNPSEETHRYDYLIDPIIHRSGVTMLYAYGGSCKGFLATLIGLMVESGEGLLGWRVPEKGRVLYLDWEDTKEEYLSRCARVSIGCGVGRNVKKMARMGMHTTLMSALPEVAARIQAIQAKFVIVDALGGAMAGNLMLPEDAGNFYNKLSQVEGVTWLVLHHRSKPQKNDPSDKKSMMGSAYWETNARSGIKVRAVKNPDLPRTMDIDLENDKNNRDEMAATKLIRIRFDGRYGPVEITERDPEDEAKHRVEAIAQKCNDSVRKLVDAVGLGQLTIKQMAEKTGEDEGYIGNIVRNNPDVFIKAKIPGTRALSYSVSGTGYTQSELEESEELK